MNRPQRKAARPPAAQKGTEVRTAALLVGAEGDGAPVRMTQRPIARAALAVVVGLAVGALTAIG